MKELNTEELLAVTGGMHWERLRRSENVFDCRSGLYCDNGQLWPSIKASWDAYGISGVILLLF